LNKFGFLCNQDFLKKIKHEGSINKDEERMIGKKGGESVSGRWEPGVGF